MQKKKSEIEQKVIEDFHNEEERLNILIRNNIERNHPDMAERFARELRRKALAITLFFKLRRMDKVMLVILRLVILLLGVQAGAFLGLILDIRPMVNLGIAFTATAAICIMLFLSQLYRHSVIKRINKELLQ